MTSLLFFSLGEKFPKRSKGENNFLHIRGNTDIFFKKENNHFTALIAVNIC